MTKKNSFHIQTNAIHVGNTPDEITGAVIPPIYQSSTFVQSSPGIHKGYEYTRSHNPTRSRLEECLASLENARHCIVTSSGMSVISLIFQSFPSGTKILCGEDVYGGTYRLLNTVYKSHFEIRLVNTSNIESISEVLEDFKPQLVWLESPTNPMLQVSDIHMISSLAHEYNATVVVDNTFMSPYFQNPLDLGADMVVHSLTKYINGHSDVVGGAVMLNKKKIIRPTLVFAKFYWPKSISL
jgi:cystathionine gamma-lyase